MNIIIVGGTQGLGRAIAERYIEQGHDVCVCGRDISKLNTWRYSKAANVSSYSMDINNKEQLLGLFDRYKNNSIDLLINCAGIYINNRTQELSQADALALLNTNVLALNQLMSLTAEKMLAQKSGHIVALSSVAALINYPGASLYSATKRSVINLCDTYRTALSPYGITVTSVVPGYINTSQLRLLNSGDASKKLFIVEEDYAANLIVKKLSQGKPQIIFPKRMHVLMKFLSLIPDQVLTFFLQPKKHP